MTSNISQADILAPRLDEIGTVLKEGESTRVTGMETPTGNGVFSDADENVADPIVAITKGDAAIIRASGAVVADTCFDKREAPTAQDTEETEDLSTDPDGGSESSSQVTG